MLIDGFGREPDFSERHQVKISASVETVYRVLWTADFGRSWIVKGLLLLRSLPKLLLNPRSLDSHRKTLNLQSIVDAGFGRLAEDEGREVVLGVVGRFWRPVDNLIPFRKEFFSGAVPAGLARAVWNFDVRSLGVRSSVLRTETRITCGDSASRRKFGLYWLFVRPFSGLIRRVMLRAVKRQCENES